MRYIKFLLQKGREVTVPEHKAQAILDSNEQMIMVTDDEGNWTGETINKAYIITTHRDYEAERDWVRENRKQLPDPTKRPITEAQKKKIELEKQRISKILSAKKHEK